MLALSLDIRQSSQEKEEKLIFSAQVIMKEPCLAQYSILNLLQVNFST